MNILVPSQKIVIDRIPETPFSLMVCMAGEFSDNILTLLKILSEQKDGIGQTGLLSSAIGLAKILEMQAQACKADEGDFMQYLQSPVRGNNSSQYFTECIIPLIGMRGRSYSEAIEAISAHIAYTLNLLLIEPNLSAPRGAPAWSKNSHVGLGVVNAFCRMLNVTAEDTIEVLEALHSGTLRQDHHDHIAGIVKQEDEESAGEHEQADESAPVPGTANGA